MVSDGNLWYKLVRRPWTTSFNGFVVNFPLIIYLKLELIVDDADRPNHLVIGLIPFRLQRLLLNILIKDQPCQCHTFQTLEASVKQNNHITPPETARPCLTLYSPAYSSSENMHYPVLAQIQLIQKPGTYLIQMFILTLHTYPQTQFLGFF